MRKGEVERQLGEATQQVQSLTEELENARAVGSIATAVQVDIDRYVSSGLMSIEAQRAVTERVTSEERDKLRREAETQIEAEEYEKIATKIRQEEGPAIRTSIETQFMGDGTIERLERNARANVKRDLEDDLLAELRDEADKVNNDPDERAKIRAELKADLDQSDQIIFYRQDLINELRSDMRDRVVEELQAEIAAEAGSEAKRTEVKEKLRVELLDSAGIAQFREDEIDRLRRIWTGEVNDELRREIVDQVASREPQIKAQIRRQLQESDAIAEYRKSQETELARKVRSLELTEVQDQVRDEELGELLGKRAEREKEKLRLEENATRLKEEFTRGDGIDVTQIEAGIPVTLYLGNRPIGQSNFRDPKTQSTIIKPTAFYVRKIKLSSLGDGRFIVNDDSLASSNSRYERDAALPDGTRLLIGRERIEDGKLSLESALFADVPLFYDTNETDTEIKSALYGVLDVVIDNVSARDVEHLAEEEKSRT